MIGKEGLARQQFGGKVGPKLETPQSNMDHVKTERFIGSNTSCIIHLVYNGDFSCSEM